MGEPRVEAVTGRPTAALAPFVGRYDGYLMTGWAPGHHRGLPSQHLTFVVSLGDPVDVCQQPGGRQPAVRAQVVLGGLHASAATIRHDGNQHGIQVNLRPAAARALFDLPAGELAHQALDLDDVVPGLGREVADRVASVDGWAARFAVLDEVLARRLADRPAPPPEVARAWDRLLTAGGNVAVADLAAEVGWSRRHLHQRFTEELGLAPKTAGRVLRFERAKQLYERADRPPLADIAVACGYYDQAHLTNEWRELVGASPTAWRDSELPSFQDHAVELG
jgi:AraC-like DNA-binding protein